MIELLSLKHKIRAILEENKINNNIDIFDINDESFYDIESFNDALYPMLEVKIEWYGTAIEYLTNNDNTLIESLSLADDMGLKLGSINSTTLAGLLATNNLKCEYEEIVHEIETCIIEYDNAN